MSRGRCAVTDRQSNVRASGWRAFLGPLARIVLAAVLVGAAVAAAQVVVKMLKGVLSLGGALPALYYLAYLIVSVLVAYFVYLTYVRLVEKRTVSELSGAGASKELGIGALVGLGLIAVIVGILWVLGYYRIVGTNAFTVVFVLVANEGAGPSSRRSCCAASSSGSPRSGSGRGWPWPSPSCCSRCFTWQARAPP
jgi:hypothetical protein